MPDKYFWDTNLWVYLNTSSENPDDSGKRSQLEDLLLTTEVIVVSAQVFNELANVLMKKYGQTESDVKTRLNQIGLQTEMVQHTEEMTYQALDLKSKYQLSWYDSLIAAAALRAGCKFLFSEDFQDGLVIEGRLTVINPVKKK